MTDKTTTLKKIRSHSPCQDGWEKLCTSLGGIKKYGENTPVKFSQIVESNGLDDALWCLRTICPEHEKEVRLFAADCAESVLHLFENKYPDDDRPRKAIQAARDFAEGKITEEELEAAARAAARAAWAARAAGAAWAAWAAGADGAARAAGAAGAAAEKEIQIEMLIERFG